VWGKAWVIRGLAENIVSILRSFGVYVSEYR